MHRCRACHRELKSPESIAQGIGPTCAARLMPPKPKKLRVRMFGSPPARVIAKAIPPDPRQMKLDFRPGA